MSFRDSTKQGRGNCEEEEEEEEEVTNSEMLNLTRLTDFPAPRVYPPPIGFRSDPPITRRTSLQFNSKIEFLCHISSHFISCHFLYLISIERM